MLGEGTSSWSVDDWTSISQTMPPPKASQFDSGREYSVTVTNEWSCRWPRPSAAFAEGLTEVKLVLCSDGSMDFSPIEEVAMQHDFGHALKWYRSLSELLGDRLGQMPLSDFLRVAAGVDELRPLVIQLLWRLSLHLEACLGAQAQGKSGGVRVKFGWRSLEDAFSDSRSIAHRVAEYVFEGTALTRAYPTLSISTDNATIKGLPTQNSVIVLPNNLGIICCPAVHRVSRRGRVVCRHSRSGISEFFSFLLGGRPQISVDFVKRNRFGV